MISIQQLSMKFSGRKYFSKKNEKKCKTKRKEKKRANNTDWRAE